MPSIPSSSTSSAADAIGSRRIAILATDGFEQAELEKPRDALQKAGYDTHILAPKAGTVQGFDHVDKADTFQVDGTIADADPGDYAAVILPGGVVNADALRTDADAQGFVKAIEAAGKPLAVICHGAWLLIDAGLVDGKTLTSWPSLQVDLRNAGATWVDEQVHSEDGWVSSRKPDDIPAFNAAILKALGST
jgi:protease I